MGSSNGSLANTSVACPFVWEVGGRNISAFCCSARDNQSDTFYLDFGYDPTLAAIIGSGAAIVVWVISVLLYLTCKYGCCFCLDNQVAPQSSADDLVLHKLQVDNPVWWEKRRIVFDILRLCATFFAAICFFPIPAFNLNISAIFAIIPLLVLDFIFFFAFLAWQRKEEFLKPLKYYVAFYIVMTGFPVGSTVKVLVAILYDDPTSVPAYALFVPHGILFYIMPLFALVFYMFKICQDEDGDCACACSCPCFWSFWGMLILLAAWVLSMVGITYYVWPQSLPYITYMEYLAPCTLSQALAPLWLLLLCSLVVTHCYFFSSVNKGGSAKSAALQLMPDLLHFYGVCCTAVILTFYYDERLKPVPDIDQYLKPFWPLLLADLLGITGVVIRLCSHCCSTTTPRPRTESVSPTPVPFQTPSPGPRTGSVSPVPGPGPFNTGTHPYHLPPIDATAQSTTAIPLQPRAQQNITADHLPPIEPSSTTAIPLPQIGQQNITAGQMHNWWSHNHRAFPDTWEEHPPDQPRCFVPTVDPKTQEYREVETGFLQSICTQDGPTWVVHKISRVQNTDLYDQYTAAKRNMDKGLPNRINERTLWHGTASDAIGNINENGFNRAYCGRNATYYGEGVYFAVAASYSARGSYAVPDGSGNRFMYRARVLVGEYTKGDKGMKEPPIKPNSGSHSRYDSVVDDTTNPALFVVFRDTSVYPEYLIEFSRSN